MPCTKRYVVFCRSSTGKLQRSELLTGGDDMDEFVQRNQSRTDVDFFLWDRCTKRATFMGRKLQDVRGFIVASEVAEFVLT